MKPDISGFLSDVGNFLKGGRVLGVDIGTTSIKIVEIVKRGGRFVLNNYGILETKEYLDAPARALYSSSVKISEERVAGVLTAFLLWPAV